MTFWGCHINADYIDRVEDKKEAEKTIDLFYSGLKEKNLIKTNLLFSHGFKKKTDRYQFEQFISNVNDQFGGLKLVNLDHWHTKIRIGTNSSSDYFLYYLNDYDRGKTEESFHLIKENDSIKIAAFNIKISNK